MFDHKPFYIYSIIHTYLHAQSSFPANAGIIKLKNRLDHEKTAFYNLTVEAKDLGTPSQQSGFASLWVTVTDIDDNAPVFHQNKYSVNVYENVSLGSFIGQVNATDVDADEAHKTVYFRIDGGNEGNIFSIGLLNGTVTLNWLGPGVNREQRAQYELTIAAISRAENVSEQKSTVRVSRTECTFL